MSSLINEYASDNEGPKLVQPKLVAAIPTVTRGRPAYRNVSPGDTIRDAGV
jgi:hypothetical protein